MFSINDHKTILVTGGTGSIGNALVKRLLDITNATIRVLSRNDSSQHELYTSLTDEKRDRVRLILGDVQNAQTVGRVARGCTLAYHCAAAKHVARSGYNANEVASVNIRGTYNVLEALDRERSENTTMVLLSTDKAVDPSNVMGASKAVAEKIVMDATWSKIARRITRFGNVWMSRGSFGPVLIDRIIHNKTIEITDLNASRYILLIDEAVQILIDAAYTAPPTSIKNPLQPFIIIPNMKAARVGTMLQWIKKLFNKTVYENSIQTICTGLVPGEKLHESLLSYHELRNVLYYKKDDRYTFVGRETVETGNHSELIVDSQFKNHLSSSGLAISQNFDMDKILPPLLRQNIMSRYGA